MSTFDSPLPGSSVQVQLASSDHGFHDYDVLGHASVKRVCVAPQMKRGDLFNVYHHDGKKTGGFWGRDLQSTLEGLLQAHVLLGAVQ